MAWIVDAKSCGKYSTETAKMMGITPAWLTFSGMYVLCPPYMRLPTTRFAYCTGMRRCPCSMNTTATTMARAIARIV